VGVRRLRSVLRSFAPRVATPPGELDDTPETWLAKLRDELKWMGAALGAVRDADVRLQGLVQECSTLPIADNMGAATLLAAAEDDQRQGHEALLGAMATERYVELLRTLDVLASAAYPTPGQVTSTPVLADKAPWPRVPAGLWARLAQPASSGLPALALHQWRAVRKAVRQLGDEPADTALHQVRIQAKRLRYLAEVAALFVTPAAHRDAAKRTGKAAARLQDVLGELHDAAVSEQWLRGGSARVPSRTRTAVVFASGLAAGELAARAQERQRALRNKWPAAWAPLRSQKLHGWMAP
jgi:CHAD domain-containing protein